MARFIDVTRFMLVGWKLRFAEVARSLLRECVVQVGVMITAAQLPSLLSRGIDERRRR